ncbi:MAG: hypothetical protein AAGC93_29390 [Cyanobacteria bacterium P01_F01_bin.53]
MLTIIIPSMLAAMFGAGIVAGLLTVRKESEAQDAADTYRAIVHRNAISEPVPFASSVAAVNAPGLVQVHPRSQSVPAPSSKSTAPVRSALPAPPSIVKPDDLSVSATSEAPKLPIEMAEAANEAEAEIIIQAWEDGSSMTKTIKSVWGISAGGGAKYKAARARYKHYLSEVTQDA